MEDTDVQFSWLLLCLDLDDEELSNELLKHVVEMWLTICGLSMANMWMEYYKQLIVHTITNDNLLIVHTLFTGVSYCNVFWLHFLFAQIRLRLGRGASSTLISQFYFPRLQLPLTGFKATDP